MLIALGDQLGREQIGQQIQGNAVFDHGKQLLIQVKQLVKCGHVVGKPRCQLLVFLVKEIGEGGEQCILSVKIVIEGTAGGSGFLYDFINGRIVVALLVEEPPGSGDNFCFRVFLAFLSHRPSPLPVSYLVFYYRERQKSIRRDTPVAVRNLYEKGDFACSGLQKMV